MYILDLPNIFSMSNVRNFLDSVTSKWTSQTLYSVPSHLVKFWVLYLQCQLFTVSHTMATSKILICTCRISSREFLIWQNRHEENEFHLDSWKYFQPSWILAKNYWRYEIALTTFSIQSFRSNDGKSTKLYIRNYGLRNLTNFDFNTYQPKCIDKTKQYKRIH